MTLAQLFLISGIVGVGVSQGLQYTDYPFFRRFFDVQYLKVACWVVFGIALGFLAVGLTGVLLSYFKVFYLSKEGISYLTVIILMVELGSFTQGLLYLPLAGIVIKLSRIQPARKIASEVYTIARVVLGLSVLLTYTSVALFSIFYWVSYF